MFSGKAAYKYLATLAVLLFLVKCSVERNTSTTRFYHGLTSKYNIYFNGYESFKAGLGKINNGYRDDFSEMLKVFQSSDPSTVSLCSSDMENAILKASKLISLKSITAKPEFKNKRDLTENEKKLLEQKEFNEWVDDSYFLIGKARFYKHEFSESASVFNYCITEANDPNIKTESILWLARINTERGNYSGANRLLSEIEISDSFAKNLKALYYSSMADMLIRQKRYSEAIDPLSNSLKYIKGKISRYRLTYLLAQLNEQTGNSEAAVSLYRDVVKMNPPYDVEFNARINIAGVFDVESGNPDEISRELEKMLKDSKNKDFQDQIYYALGNLMKKEGRINEALEYYKKSASSNSLNQNQKGKSYLALAEYYYGKPDYINAGKYFDSTVYFLDAKYPNYNELKTRSQNLNSLVEPLKVIQVEDSLQHVAALPKNERDALIAGIIAKIQEDESEGRSSEYTDRANIGQYYENQRRFQDNIAQEGRWYFYNQTALTFGRTEFRRRWGDRRLEDNWRRSNRNRVNLQQETASQDQNGTNGSDTANAILDYKKPEFYLKNLPLNDSLIAVSDEKIANAYFNAGKVFADKIQDIQKAAESYESLLSRFPGNSLVPETLYDLYNLYREENKQKAEIARQRLLEKYPESEFSKILSDPDYYNKKMADIRKSERLYEDAYNLYISGKYYESINLCDSALKYYSQEILAPKFMLLRAYSTARTSDERNLREELSRIIKNWPDTEESKRAAEIIVYLDKKLPELKIEEDIEIAKEIYVVDTTLRYSFVVIIMDPGFNINQASFDIISHNIDNYTNNNYRTEAILDDNRYLRITVSGFSNNNEAWDYYNAFRAEQIIRNSNGARIITFLINKNNLQKLEEDKNPERYFLFFNENYLPGKKE